MLIRGYITSVSLELFILSKICERLKIIIVKTPSFKIIQMVTNVFFGKRSLRVPNIKQSVTKRRLKCCIKYFSAWLNESGQINSYKNELAKPKLNFPKFPYPNGPIYWKWVRDISIWNRDRHISIWNRDISIKNRDISIKNRDISFSLQIEISLFQIEISLILIEISLFQIEISLFQIEISLFRNRDISI